MSSEITHPDIKSRNSLWFVLILFGLTASVLVWNSQGRLEKFEEQHDELMKTSVKGTSRAITLKLKELRRAVSLFGEREAELLLELVNEEENFDAYEQIVEKVETVFPQAFAVTLADSNGKPYIDDFDGIVSQQCIRDIKTFAHTNHSSEHPPEPYLHTNPNGYHIDIMVRINLNESTPVIFFVSFRPEFIIELLKNNQLSDHNMILTHFTKSRLIEITADGSRKILGENILLTGEEVKRIGYTKKVDGALWNLAYMSDNEMSVFRKHIWNETGVVLFILLIFSIFMLRLLSRSEFHIMQARHIAEDANNSKSAFLANMSHEIRTPLTAIIGFANTLMAKEPSTVERNHAANTIIQNGQHLLSLINNILDLSKIEAGKLEVEQVLVSPFQVIFAINSLMKPQAEKKNLLFVLEYNLPLPALIKSDPTRLKQILINICSNALKFTEKGQIILRVTHDKEKQALRFDISDTGIGLTKEQADTIFDEFTQADASTTRRFGGTGLGLSLTQKLVHLLGGTLSVTSEYGVGSQFTLSVDTGAIENIEIIHDEKQIPEYFEPVEVEQTTRLSGSVLLAEDIQVNQELFSIYIDKIGPRLTIVANGKEAVERALNEKFDLILMDMQMPVMDGVEAVSILREKGCKVPIIAFTANAMKEDMDRCLQSGFDYFLTKPIQQSELYAKMAEILPEEKQDQDGVEPIISNILDNEPELHDIVVRFIVSLPKTIDQMKQAARLENWDRLNILLHQLVSTSGGLGFPDVMKLCRVTETTIRAKNYVQIDKLLSDLKNLSDRITAGKNKWG